MKNFSEKNQADIIRRLKKCNLADVSRVTGLGYVTVYNLANEISTDCKVSTLIKIENYLNDKGVNNG